MKYLSCQDGVFAFTDENGRQPLTKTIEVVPVRAEVFKHQEKTHFFYLVYVPNHHTFAALKAPYQPAMMREDTSLAKRLFQARGKLIELGIRTIQHRENTFHQAYLLKGGLEYPVKETSILAVEDEFLVAVKKFQEKLMPGFILVFTERYFRMSVRVTGTRHNLTSGDILEVYNTFKPPLTASDFIDQLVKRNLIGQPFEYTPDLTITTENQALPSIMIPVN